MDTTEPKGLTEIELMNIDQNTGDPPVERLSGVTAALSIYQGLVKADESSSTNRSRTDALFDGAPPYDPAVLLATRQGSRTNLNFGEAQRYLDVAMSSYVDLYSSLERLVSVKLSSKSSPENRSEIEDVISEEITNTLRSLPEFHTNYLRLCAEFTKHGVSVAYFDTTTDWRFRVCGLNEFQIPRQSVASEEGVEVAVARRDYLLHELYGFIRDEEAAEAIGWDCEETKRVLCKNATTSGTTTRTSNWEEVQREFKNNDLYTGHRNTCVSVIHMWVREFDGTVSFYMFAENGPKTFLFKEVSRYEAPEQAFVMFSYGVGTNGTYHSVRGLGYRIFNHIQVSNRLRCQMVDAAILAGSVMLQPASERDLEKLSFTVYGPYSVLSSGLELVEKQPNNLSQTMTPALQEMSNQLSLNVDLMSTYGPNLNSPYRNELQTEHDISVASRLSGSTLNLFYNSWSRLLREITRRLCEGSSDVWTKRFRARCAERGVTTADIKNIDHTRTTAVRAIGAGSTTNRLLALREINQYAGSFDETGRKQLVRDIVASRVGHDIADRYVPRMEGPRQTSQTKVAMLENVALAAGNAVEVMSSEPHIEHLSIHITPLQEHIAAIQTGEQDLGVLLPIASVLFEHVSAHMEFLAQDPTAQAEVAEMNKMMQIAHEVITNFGRRFQKEQREAAQGGEAQEGAPDAGPSATELRMQEHQLRMQMAREKAELEMQIRQSKAEQDLATKDAERALKISGYTDKSIR
jgi:hypothetical protein